MCKMIRTFHPVGQGLFCTEKFVGKEGKQFNIVYDCGSESPGLRSVYAAIRKTFKPGEGIEAVFISHFDRDHVNGLPFLAERCNVKRLYLPMLVGDVEIALTKFASLARARTNDSAVAFHLLERMERDNNRSDNEPKWLRKVEKVIPVRNETSEHVCDELSNALATSCEVRGVDGRSAWRFIPFNNQQKERESLYIGCYERAAASCGINLSIDDFIQDSASRFSSIPLNKRKKLLTAINAELKQALGNCAKGMGDVNSNSMTLYSGGTINNGKVVVAVASYSGVTSSQPRSSSSQRRSLCSENAHGCLYFGDYNAKDKDSLQAVKDFYGKIVDCQSIGCVQLPHHGSTNNFNDELAQLESCFVASFRTDYKYKHPHDEVVAKLQGKKRTLYISDENMSCEGKVGCNIGCLI